MGQREQGLYIGDGTLTAELARQRRLLKSLGAGSGQWLAAVLGAVLGKKAPGLPPQEHRVAAFSRAVLRHCGYDPETHTLSRKVGDFAPGMVVRDQLGLACRFIPAKKLREMQRDEAFVKVALDEVGGEQ